MKRILLGLTLLAMGCFPAAGEGDLFPCDAGLCHADGTPALADAGTVDAGTVDAGTVDAGTADAGTADAGTADAGTADAGTADAGTVDAGTADAGTADAGTADAGTADAGTADAGTVDAGLDAGGEDAGSPDAGFDAGPPDSGFDAGAPDAGSTCIESGCANGTHCFGGVCAAVASMPTARAMMAVAVGGDGLIYVLGGFSGSPCALSGSSDGGSAVATAEAYDPVANAWTSLGDMPTARLLLAAALGDDGRIYAMGGDSAIGGTTLSVVEAWTLGSPPATGYWTSEVANNFAPRAAFVTGVLGQEIFLAAGHVISSGSSSDLGSVQDLLVPSAWTTELPVLPNPRENVCGTQDGVSRLYVIGGSPPQGGSASTAEVDRYDMTSPSSPFVQSSLPLPVQDCAAAYDPGGNRLYVAAGGENLPDGGWISPPPTQVLDVSTGAWSSVAPFPTAAAQGVAAISPKRPDLLFVFGGLLPSCQTTSAVQAYSISAGHW